MMGKYLLILCALELALVGCSIVRQQRFAFGVAATGVAVLLFWWLSVYFEVPLLFEQLAINLYLMVIVGIGVTFAGVFGLLVKGIRLWIKRGISRHRNPLPKT